MNVKKVLILSAVALLLISGVAGSCAAAETVPDTSWYTGQDSTYTLNTAEDLAGLAAIVNGTATGIKSDTFKGVTILIGSDIMINDPEKVQNNDNTLKVWESIGKIGGNVFEGTIDGQNHTITGLYSTTNGFIGNASNVTVKNLTFNYSTIASNDYVVGMVLGFSDGDTVVENVHIKSCYVRNYSNSTGDIGGIIGEVIRGKLTGCSITDSQVICNNCDYTGGLIGYIDDVTSFTDCAADNTVIVCAKSGAGGIGGYAFTDVSFTGCTVKNCYIQSFYDNYVGGLLGFGGSEVNIDGCHIDNSIVKGYKHSVGGVVGYAYHANFINHPTTVTDTIIIAEAEEYVGGFIGSANKPITIAVENCAITSCAVSGNVATQSSMMGLVTGRGTVSEDSKSVTVTKTVIGNKAIPSQNITDFNTKGVNNNLLNCKVSTNIRETVNGESYGTTEKTFDVPTLEGNLTTKTTQSPFPILGVLAGLGAAAFFLRRR